MKKLIMKCMASVILGFFGHQVNFLLDKMPHGWRHLSGDGTGAILLLLSGQMYYTELETINDERRFSIALVLAIASVGLGVVVSWVADSLLGIEHKG